MERIEIDQNLLKSYNPYEQAATPAPAAPEQVVAPEQAAPEQVAAPAPEQVVDNSTPEQVIVDMKTVEFENLLKVLLKISDGASAEDILQIKSGLLTMSKYGGIVKTDLTPLIGNTSWDIINPNRTIKILKLLKNGDRIKIISDGTQQYVYNLKNTKIINTVKLFTPTTKAKGESLIQDMDLGERVSRIELDANIIKDLNTMKAMEDVYTYDIEIDVNTNEIVSIGVNDVFVENLVPPEGRDIVKFKVQELFVSTTGDSFVMDLHKDANGDYKLRSILNENLIDIELKIGLLKTAQVNDLDIMSAIL